MAHPPSLPPSLPPYLSEAPSQTRLVGQLHGHHVLGRPEDFLVPGEGREGGREGRRGEKQERQEG